MQLWTESLASKMDTETRARIIGVQTQMTQFEYFFGLILDQRLFSISDNLSKTLQKTKIFAIQGQRLAKMTKRTIQGMRTDSDFKAFYALILQRKNAVSDPKLPRKHAPPKNVHDGKSEQYHAPPLPTAEDQYSGLYISRQLIT